MKIAIVTNNFPTPSETFISNKVLQLATKGHEIIVFCSSFDGTLWASINTARYKVAIELVNRKVLAKYIALHPLLWLKVGVNGNGKPSKIASKIFVARVNKYKPDIVHFEFSGIGIHYLDTLQSLHGKKVVSCRGSAEKVKLLVDAERQQKMEMLFNLVDGIHCVSDDMRATILPYCDKAEKIFVNYPSINAEAFKRNTIYSWHKPLNILSIGRFTFQKGYLTGLLAIRIFKKSGLHFHWTIVGDGPQREEIIFHINHLGLNQVVTLAGTKTVNEVKKLYNECDIFFLPSVYEGIANVALEAMSMKLPVVSTRSGGMDEVISHGIDGMLADVYDSEKLASLLQQLANDQGLCVKLGERARQRVLEKFTIETQIQKFETVYTALASTALRTV